MKLILAGLAVFVGVSQTPAGQPTVLVQVKQKPCERKEALGGRWVSADADKVPVEFGADGSIRLALFTRDWKGQTAEGTYVVRADGKVNDTAKRGGLTARGRFTRKAGVRIGPLDANAEARRRKLPPDGAPPSALKRDPDEAFGKACELVAALEGKHDLLKGVSRVKPIVQRDEQKRLKSAQLVFANNAAPPGKNAVTAKDNARPFFYVSVQVWFGRSQSPPANLHEFKWQGQTYQMWVRVYGSDAELVKMVRKALEESLRQPSVPALLDPLLRGRQSSGNWPGSRSSLQALAPVTTTVSAAVAREKAEIQSRSAAHLSTRRTTGKGEAIEGGGYVFFAQCRQKFQVVEVLHGNGQPGERVLEYGFVLHFPG